MTANTIDQPSDHVLHEQVDRSIICYTNISIYSRIRFVVASLVVVSRLQPQSATDEHYEPRRRNTTFRVEIR